MPIIPGQVEYFESYKKIIFTFFVENPETCVAARKLRKKNVTVRLKTSGAELSWESLQIKKDKYDNHDADLMKASGHNHSWESLQIKKDKYDNHDAELMKASKRIIFQLSIVMDELFLP